MGFDRDSKNLFNCYKLIQEQQIFNPWPNEPIPSGEDTINYRDRGFTSDIPRSVDYSQLVQKYIGDRQAFAKLPQDEQVKRMTSLIDDFASQANLSSTWANDVKRMAIVDDIRGGGRKVVFPNGALSNFDYSNRQMQSYNAASPEEKAKMDKAFQDFWKEKQNVSNYETLQQQQKEIFPQRKEEFTRALQPIQDELKKLRREKPQGWEQKRDELTAKLESESNKLIQKYAMTDPNTGKPILDPKEIEKLIKSSEQKIKDVQIPNAPINAPSSFQPSPATPTSQSSPATPASPTSSPSSSPNSPTSQEAPSFLSKLGNKLTKPIKDAYNTVANSPGVNIPGISSLSPDPSLKELEVNKQSTTSPATPAVPTSSPAGAATPSSSPAARATLPSSPAAPAAAPSPQQPGLVGRVAGNVTQAVYNSPQLGPLRTVANMASNAMSPKVSIAPNRPSTPGITSNIASNVGSAIYNSPVMGPVRAGVDAYNKVIGSANTEQQRQIALANARAAQARMVTGQQPTATSAPSQAAAPRPASPAPSQAAAPRPASPAPAPVRQAVSAPSPVGVTPGRPGTPAGSTQQTPWYMRPYNQQKITATKY